MDGERMKHKLFWIWVTAVVTCREIYCDKFTSQYARASETENNGKDPKADSCGSSLSRFGDETKPNIYYFCNMNKEKKWIVYTFSCPKGTVFMKHLEKCSRLELPPISTSTSISVTKRKKPHLSSTTTTVKTTTIKTTTTARTTRMTTTSKPYVIHSWSESLKEIQDLILKNTNRYPFSVNTNTNKPFVVSAWKGQVPPSKVYFQEIINNPSTLSSPKPVIYNSGGISYSLVNTGVKTQSSNLSTSTATPSNLQTTTKINLFSSGDMSTTQPKVTTEPPSTTVPLSKQDELVVRDFIIKFTKPLIPFLGSANYGFSSQPQFPDAVGVPDKEPLAPELPSRLPSSFLPLPFPSATRLKPKLKIKLPIPNPTNGFSVQLLERFGVKLVPEDQFFFKRKPTVQNFTSTIYSSPEEASIYEPPLILGTPVNLPNHLHPLPLPPLWFADVESRDHDETVTHPANYFNHTTPNTAPVSRKPRV